MPKGIRLDIEKGTALDDMIRCRRYRVYEIAERMNVSRQTVAEHKRKLRLAGEIEEPTVEQKNMTKKERLAAKKQMVEEAIRQGWTKKEIRNVYNIGGSQIDEIAEAMDMEPDEQQDEEQDMNLYMWLVKNWRWKLSRRNRARINPDTGMRIVYKGEKSNFRTPYRPDGMWR